MLYLSTIVSVTAAQICLLYGFVIGTKQIH